MVAAVHIFVPDEFLQQLTPIYLLNHLWNP
jgi:hypothetical protein